MSSESTSSNEVQCTLENSAGLWAGTLSLTENTLSFEADGAEEKKHVISYSLAELRKITSLAGRNILMVDAGEHSMTFAGSGLNKFGLDTINSWNQIRQKNGAFPLQFEHLRSSAGTVDDSKEPNQVVRAKELCLHVTQKGYSPGLLSLSNQWVGFGPTDTRGDYRDEFTIQINLVDVRGVRVIHERNETVIQTAHSYERFVGDGAIRMGDRMRVILGNKQPSSTLMRLKALATAEIPILEDIEKEEAHLGNSETVVAEGRCIGRVGQMSLPGKLILTTNKLRFTPDDQEMWGNEDTWEKSLEDIERISVLGADRAVFWVKGEASRFLGREANEVGTKILRIRGMSLSDEPKKKAVKPEAARGLAPPDWPDAAIVPFERVLGLAHTIEVFVQQTMSFASKPCRFTRIDDGVGILLPEAPHSSLSWGEELRIQLFRDDGRYYFDALLIRTGLAPRDTNIGDRPAWYMLTIQEGLETRFSNLRSSERVAIKDHLVRVNLSPDDDGDEAKTMQSSLVNLSAGGCLIRNETSLSLGQKVGLQFELTDGPIELNAECLRSIRPRRRDQPWHCAFVFVDLSDSDEARISHFVDALVVESEEQ